MSALPPLIKENEPTDAEWRRKVRDLLNLVARRSAGSGKTAERPPRPSLGTYFFDETLNRPIWYGATGWIKADGTAA